MEIRKSKERILLVVLEMPGKKALWSSDDILKEMTELVVACDGLVVDSVVLRVKQPSAGYLITEGRVEEIAELCKLKNIQTAIFSEDLKGSQQRNLEDGIGTRTIDRTQLILDIFARRATSNEGKMQVELAQLEYLMPRLVGHGQEMSRLGGGIGTSGPGETKLEVDRRRIAERIARLKRDLKTVSDNWQLKRKKRQNKSIPSVSLVGYTNAGKSTLLNCLTDAEQVTKDGLFTTLDSLSRQMVLPNHQKLVISDTVGFMHDLPHHLIESFKTTLEEVKEADVLLHVLDASHPNFRNLYESVNIVLRELNAYEKPTILVLNKIDKIEDKSLVKDLVSNFENAVAISAKTGLNILELKEMLISMLSSLIVEINLDIPIARMDLITLVHDEGEVYSIKYYDTHVNIRAVVPVHLAGKFEKVAIKKK